MAEGFVDLFQCEDTTNNKPHYRGYLKIEGANHEFALWPSKKGNGYNGKYKPKEERQPRPEPAKPAPMGLGGDDILF